jgi:ABC-2 type transport system ATP-binding protein
MNAIEMNAIDVRNVSHAFGRMPVLRDVSLSVAPATFAVLLGPNGAGKTTLFSLITRLYHARSGSISIFGHDVQRAPGLALATMGVLFQQTTLDLDLTVIENLRYHGSLHGLARKDAEARAAAALERFGMAERQRQLVRSLSGGERRRVEIARALLHRPRLLLFDEPTVGLDPASRRAILAHVRDLRAQEGLTVLWSTHLLDEITADDQVFMLEKGQLVKSAFGRDLDLLPAGAP